MEEQVVGEKSKDGAGKSKSIHKCTEVQGEGKCNKIFTRKFDLNRHRNAVHFNKKHKCTLCHVECSTKANLVRHQQQHQPEGIKFIYCDSCGRGFNSVRARKNHIQHHHHKTTRFPCEKCKNIFYYTEALKSHMRIHNRNIKCRSCSERFSQYKKKYEHEEKIHGFIKARNEKWQMVIGENLVIKFTKVCTATNVNVAGGSTTESPSGLAQNQPSTSSSRFNSIVEPSTGSSSKRVQNPYISLSRLKERPYIVVRDDDPEPKAKKLKLDTKEIARPAQQRTKLKDLPAPAAKGQSSSSSLKPVKPPSDENSVTTLPVSAATFTPSSLNGLRNDSTETNAGADTKDQEHSSTDHVKASSKAKAQVKPIPSKRSSSRAKKRKAEIDIESESNSEEGNTAMDSHSKKRPTVTYQPSCKMNPGLEKVKIESDYIPIKAEPLE